MRSAPKYEYNNIEDLFFIRREKSVGRLIIDGNRVYELDEACLKKRKLPEHPPAKDKDDRNKARGR